MRSTSADRRRVRARGGRRVLTLAGLLLALALPLAGSASAAGTPAPYIDSSGNLVTGSGSSAAGAAGVLGSGSSTSSTSAGTATRGTSVPKPAAPSRPSTPSRPTSISVDLGGTGDSPLNSPVSLVLLLGAITLIPALLIMTTAFTRIVIVLGFVRSALGTNGIPPNQVVIGLALFLSLFVMAPTFSKANEQALQPFTHGQISQSVALQRGLEPFREFMLKQVREEDLSMFIQLSGDERPAGPEKVKTTTLVPAFVLSELRTAFLIGFVIFIPFIIIDLVVSAALSAMGMVMLPPVLISLPFKLLLFVAANGWSLVVQSLLSSFHQ